MVQRDTPALTGGGFEHLWNYNWNIKGWGVL